MNVSIKLFAAARQLAGCETLSFDCPQGTSVADARELMLQQCPQLRPLVQHMRFALNSQYVDDDATISDTDEIACIPPVSGG